MMKFRKKPVVIEAICFEPGLSPADFHAFVGSFDGVRMDSENHRCFIQTLEGVMRADEGDWIIRGVKGELYPCKPDIFEQTYERADPGPEGAS